MAQANWPAELKAEVSKMDAYASKMKLVYHGFQGRKNLVMYLYIMEDVALGDI